MKIGGALAEFEQLELTPSRGQPRDMSLDQSQESVLRIPGRCPCSKLMAGIFAGQDIGQRLL